MKILGVGAAPWVGSGAGKPLREVLPRLESAGHDVGQVASHGFEGGLMRWNGIPVLPPGNQFGARGVVVPFASHARADLVIHLGDLWNMEPRGSQFLSGWCPWFPVDHEPLSPRLFPAMSRARRLLTFSRYGVAMCAAAGIQARYLPVGIDTRVFVPSDRAAAREAFGLPNDAFLVGMVGSNSSSPSRKAFPLCIEAFAEFHRDHPDSILYLHATEGRHGEFGGVNLRALIDVLGIGGSVRFPDPYELQNGIQDAQMALLYASFDVFLMPSLGEGGATALVEAQACGIPGIVGDWTAMPEFLAAGWRIAKGDSDPWWTAFGAFQYLARRGAIVEALREARRQAGDRELAARAHDGVMPFDIDAVVAAHWLPLLDEIETENAERRRGAADVAGVSGAFGRTEPDATGPPTSRSMLAHSNPKASVLVDAVAHLQEGATIVEVGCLRCPTEAPLDGWSTLYLAKEARNRGGIVHSVDSSAANLRTAREIVERQGLGDVVRFSEMRGEEFLAGFEGAIDFLFLDGSDDPAEALAQFEAARPRLGAAARVAIDDCHDYGGNAFGKGTCVIPRARELGWTLRLVPTVPPFRTAVLRRI